jgi:hypothetical protein
VGDEKGKPKYQQACAMGEEQAHHLLGAIRAQASTEFGSIQQHQLTLARAQSEQDQFWVLRMMAEELRHGYQMLHLLLEDDWSAISGQSGADMVEEILSMRTGSHVLGAFNIDFDSFVDNIVFCALIDRVGKYQLSMSTSPPASCPGGAWSRTPRAARCGSRWRPCRSTSTSGCRAGSRCSGTRRAATPTSSTASSR